MHKDRESCVSFVCVCVGEVVYGYHNIAWGEG